MVTLPSGRSGRAAALIIVGLLGLSAASAAAEPRGCAGAEAHGRWLTLADSGDIEALRAFATDCAGAQEARLAGRRIRALRRRSAAPEAPDPEAANRGNSPAPKASVAAEAAWRNIADTRDADALRGFVLEFPDSPRIPAAHRAIAELIQDYRRAQRALRRLGDYRGAVDGDWGRASRRAYRRRQRSAGLTPIESLPSPQRIELIERLASNGAPPPRFASVAAAIAWLRPRMTPGPVDPGFDCAAASKAIEAVMCADGRASRAERRMNESWTRVRAALRRRRPTLWRSALAEQRRWLERRNRLCAIRLEQLSDTRRRAAAADCLATEAEARDAALRRLPP